MEPLTNAVAFLNWVLAIWSMAISLSPPETLTQQCKDCALQLDDDAIRHHDERPVDPFDHELLCRCH